MTTREKYDFYMTPDLEIDGHCFYNSIDPRRMLDLIEEFLVYWASGTKANYKQHIQRCHEVKGIILDNMLNHG